LTLNNIVTLNFGLGSLKVIEIGATRKLGFGLLFTFYSNCGRLRDIQRQRMVRP